MSQSYTTSAIPTPFQPHREAHHSTHNDPIGSTGAAASDDEIESASPLISCMLAGGFGGAIGDSAMHSLDTVKTRQQGLLFNPKYNSMIPAYTTILKEEGFLRGLYGGYSPAILGSFPSTAAFFGTYEFTKRTLINDLHINDTVAYLAAGILGDLALSVFYVPSEVLKTRLQLQGRHNNPYTKGCGYNYKGLRDAVRSIARTEGVSALTFGYKETLFRDLPFSALQLAFYEKFRLWAINYNGRSADLSVPAELLTGAAAGGLAGTLTTPLDVIKTRIQTATLDTAGLHQESTQHRTLGLGASILKRFSTLNALVAIHRNEGVLGLFSGVGPRFIWTGVQSSIMLLLYQVALKKLNGVFGEKVLE
ncbi:mitochondrial carrier [Metschnikowia bicuspidata var. bicuspidata NRRL YB-4993]|uniref:Mitochondrial carrier n=1 Tax=Metschnikowia bicuspidata var. bicuspidata NRRL YB-4993 TaxID=869754 RepID=A0A1A0H5S7_9ASCO|nr:mitochondrial carrier [Metschnikowia bicuspidata var. bicuspidata NRRL YB-4993]OBA19386.1 mitochondrial carrier [Metschnikowia bicuspidata var. bicuspidata NRRL YB-4993]